MTEKTLCVLRYSRLGRLPPSLYAVKELHKCGLRLLAIEYGNIQEPIARTEANFPRIRVENRWARWIPKPMRGAAIFFGTFVKLWIRFLTAPKPSLFYTHGISEQVLALMLGTVFRVPWVCHVHEVFDPNEVNGFNRLLLLLEPYALRRAQWLIFPEQERAELYRQRYRLRNPVHTVFNCPPMLPQSRSQETVREEDWRARLQLSDSTILLGYFGGISKWNCLEDGIRAVARLPKVHFLIWGWGEPAHLERLKELSTGVGCKHRIHFMGELPEDKWTAIRGLDLSYCVYQPELLRLKNAATASNKLMESLACGVPVITNPTPDFRNIVETHDVGISIGEFSVSAIAEALSKLSTNEILRKRLSQNAFELHAKSFHFETCFEIARRRFESFLGSEEVSVDLPTSATASRTY